MHIFEKASKSHLRFNTSMGTLNVEDLWDIPLEKLDTLAVNLKKEVEDDNTVSFIHENKTIDPTLQLSFDIVKRVIEIRLAERTAKKKAAENRAQKARIMELIAKKQDEAFSEKSLEELRGELYQLDSIEIPEIE